MNWRTWQNGVTLTGTTVEVVTLIVPTIDLPPILFKQGFARRIARDRKKSKVLAFRKPVPVIYGAHYTNYQAEIQVVGTLDGLNFILGINAISARYIDRQLNYAYFTVEENDEKPEELIAKAYTQDELPEWLNVVEEPKRGA